MAVTQALRAVRALLNEPERWTKGAMARDASGTPVRADSAEATCWCLTGACVVVVGYGAGIATLASALDSIVGNYVQYGDAESTTHGDIMRLLDAAIQAQAVAP